MKEYFILAGVWLVYFFLHSALVSDGVKSFFLRQGISSRHYRLLYNILAIILLVPIYLIIMSNEIYFVLEPTTGLKIVGLIITGYGVMAMRWAIKTYDMKSFIGIVEEDRSTMLKTDGPLKYVRHPLYSGSMLILIGYFLFSPKMATLISVIMIIGYFYFGSLLEEGRLTKRFGDSYRKYQEKTPMFIPDIRALLKSKNQQR